MSSSWPHQWETETRSTVVEFGGDYAYYLPSPLMWVELLILVILEACVAAVFSLVVYEVLILPRRRQPMKNGSSPKSQNGHAGSKTQSTITTQQYLITFALLLPFWMFVPHPTINALGIFNKTFRFCLCVITPTTALFRTLEALYGYAPAYAQASRGDYALYFASPMYLQYNDDGYVKTTSKVVWSHFGRFVLLLHVTGAYQSLFYYPQWTGFPTLGDASTMTPPRDLYLSIAPLLDMSRWKDNALYALLLQMYLIAYGEGLMFVTNALTGIQTERFMENPMLTAVSPSDFWGRKWNLLIHRCLKQGVYKPVRFVYGGSAWAAVVASFCASGLFHEWLLPSVFVRVPDNLVVHGPTFFFFLWQAGLITIEYAVSGNKLLMSLARQLPRPCVTLCVICCGLPVAHWFLEAWVRSDFFHHGALTFPMLVALR